MTFLTSIAVPVVYDREPAAELALPGPIEGSPSLVGSMSDRPVRCPYAAESGVPGRDP